MKSLATVQKHHLGFLEYFKKVGGGIKSLLVGMRLTLGYLIHPKKVVTRQYPENRETLTLTPRFRARVIMPHDEQREHKCTSCGLCQRACPNGSINILSTKDLAGKKVLGQFVYRLSTCTLCNLCIEACPFGAIFMGQDFELATYEREPLELILNEKEGR